MVTSPEQSGKENVPDNCVAPPAPSKQGKQVSREGNTKHEKSKTMMISQDLAVEPVVMNQAFNKLLVRLLRRYDFMDTEQHMCTG